MIITRLSGGLGNQLFQYAMARGLAERHKASLLLDATNYGPNGEQRPEELASFKRPLAIFQFRIKARQATPDKIAELRDNYWSSSTRDRKIGRAHV